MSNEMWPSSLPIHAILSDGRGELRLEPSIRQDTTSTMPKLPINPEVADVAPADAALTSYDEQHVVTYMRLLQAESEGADWREASRIILLIDPERERDRARKAYQSHLARAKWMTEQGRLLRGTGSN
jgi:hypothetical protein